MPQTIVITMTGQLPTPPYQSVFWTVYGEPDNTGAQSGYGADYLINVGVDSVSQTGSAVDPFTLAVGGDLTGNLPDPYVSGLQGNPISSTDPTNGQYLVWNGSAWTPTTVSIPSSNVGGDLSGTLPNPTVVKIQGRAISSQAPSTEQILTWSGTEWIGNTLTLAGDVTGATGSNSVNNLQGIPLTANAPTSGQILAYNGARWIQTSPGTPIATASAFASTANTLALRDSNGSIQFGSSGNNVVQIGGGLVAGPRNASFGLSQTAMTSDLPTNDILVTTQAPFTPSSGTNRLPGDLILNIPLASGVLSTTNSGNFIIQFDGDPRIQFYENPSGNIGYMEFISDGIIAASNNLTVITGAFQVNSDASIANYATGAVEISGDSISMIANGAGITIDDAGGFGILITSGGGRIEISANDFLLSTGIQFNPNSGGTYTVQPQGDAISSSVGASMIVRGADCTGLTSTGGDAELTAGTGTSTDGSARIKVGSNTRVQANGTGLGFFAAAPVAKPTVTGSKGANAALASLMTALSSLGLVTNSTS